MVRHKHWQSRGQALQQSTIICRVCAEATQHLLGSPVEEILPSWYTPHRLMALFCSILFLAYLDMGCFASNGVNGSLEPRMGIQVKASHASGHCTQSCALTSGKYIPSLCMQCEHAQCLLQEYSAFHAVQTSSKIDLVGFKRSFASLMRRISNATVCLRPGCMMQQHITCSFPFKHSATNTPLA